VILGNLGSLEILEDRYFLGFLELPVFLVPLGIPENLGNLGNLELLFRKDPAFLANLENLGNLGNLELLPRKALAIPEILAALLLPGTLVHLGLPEHLGHPVGLEDLKVLAIPEILDLL
jgi:hypothetical protein